MLYTAQQWETGCMLQQRFSTDPMYTWAEGSASSPVLFYVPLPLGMFKDRFNYPRAKVFTELLAGMLDNPDWHKNHGSNHFTFARYAQNTEYLRRHLAGATHDSLKNIVSLTECFSGTLNGARYLAQPFPGPVRHDHGHSKAAPIATTRRRQSNTSVLVTMVAGTRIVANKRFARVREVIKSQCVVYGSDCHLLELHNYGGGHVDDNCNRSVFNGKCTGASTFSRLRELSWPKHHDVTFAIAEAYSAATFCLQSGGDQPSRKGIFDAIAYGCIPVVFDHRSLGVFIQHVEDPDAIAIYIPKEFVMDGSLHVLQHLRAIPESRIKQMQSNLRAVQHRLQYSVGPARVPQAPQGASKTDYEDLMDAVDVTVDHLMRGADTTMPWLSPGPWFDNFTEHRLVINVKNFDWSSGKC